MTQDQDGRYRRVRPAERDTAREESLADSFWAVARQLRETSQETLAPWDITPGHLRALRVLSRNGPIRLSMLSDKLHIAPRSATEVADALESRGLIERQPDPTDRRATLVQLTERARACWPRSARPAASRRTACSAGSARPTRPTWPASWGS